MTMATEAFRLTNVAAGTYTFTLLGGVYAWDTKSTGSGTVDLKIIAGDNTTAIAVATQITATSGFQSPMYLPPGNYEIVIATFTASYVVVARVPI